MDQVREGTSPYHFIEVMGCPGGCITGGGQPRPQEDINIVRQKRMEVLMERGKSATPTGPMRTSP